MELVLETNGKMGKGITLDHDPNDLLNLQELLKGWGFKAVEKVGEYDPNTFYLSYHKISPEKNVWTLKRGYLPGMYYVDPLGYAGWSSVAKFGIPKVPNKGDEKIKDYLKNKPSKYKQSGLFMFPDKFIFVPLQMENDEVSKLAHINSVELAEILSTVYENVVVKPHPGGNKRLPKGCTITDASIHSIIPKAMAVYTVNSGVGFEALLYGKKVVVSGDSDYDIVCTKVKDRDEIISSILLTQKDPSEYLNYMLNYYFLDVNDPKSIEYHKKRIWLITSQRQN